MAQAHDTPSSDTSPAAPLLARIARIAGAAALIVPVLGIAAIQVGLASPMQGFGGLWVGLLAALVAIACAGVTGVVALVKGAGSQAGARGPSLQGTGAALLLLVFVAVGALSGGNAPPINDISTDVDSPPAFAEPALVPDYAGRDMSFPESFGPVIYEAYPDLGSIESSRPAATAFSEALAIAERLGWEIAHQDPGQGSFDARQTSALFRFVDDITVRVRPDGSGSVIDVRSKSRDGRGDLGVNAARIRDFAAGMRAAEDVAAR